ncbi:MAG: hypothetical protein KJ630_14780, partial [Proteobacteria bacterium]|nr:hypothetical protein [Pseudomonadota bacterium]
MSKFTPPTATALDKAIGKVFPGWAAGRAKSRLELAMAESYTGASKTRRSMVNWNTAGGDFDSDTLPELPHLRERSEDLYHNNML